MKTLLKEFKEFAVKGNVVDMAVGVIVGGAFGKIVTSPKKVYAFTPAAALRAKEAVMTTATNIREGADDILADAKALNEKYAAEDAPETIEDAAE